MAEVVEPAVTKIGADTTVVRRQNKVLRRLKVATQAKQMMLSGLRKASQKHKDSLMAAQFVAELLGSGGGNVCADDVTHYVSSKALGAACGAIFSGEQWEPVGFRQSDRPARRTGVQRVWRLRATMG
jgi:hypothetical protein